MLTVLAMVILCVCDAPRADARRNINGHAADFIGVGIAHSY